jgi:hypothetical protein
MRRIATGWKGRKDELARGSYQGSFSFFAAKSRMSLFSAVFSAVLMIFVERKSLIQPFPVFLCAGLRPRRGG